MKLLCWFISAHACFFQFSTLAVLANRACGSLMGPFPTRNPSQELYSVIVSMSRPSQIVENRTQLESSSCKFQQNKICLTIQRQKLELNRFFKAQDNRLSIRILRTPVFPKQIQHILLPPLLPPAYILSLL